MSTQTLDELATVTKMTDEEIAEAMRGKIVADDDESFVSPQGRARLVDFWKRRTQLGVRRGWKVGECIDCPAKDPGWEVAIWICDPCKQKRRTMAAAQRGAQRALAKRRRR